VADRLTILIADDHAPTRAGVRAVLDGGGFAVVAVLSTMVFSILFSSSRNIFI